MASISNSAKEEGRQQQCSGAGGAVAQHCRGLTACLAARQQSGDSGLYSSVSGGGGSYRGRGSNSTGGGWWGGGSMWRVRHMAALPQQKGALLLLSDGKCSLGWSRVCLHTELWKVRCFSFENDVRM